MCRTSSHSIGSTSGCGSLTTVVPRMSTFKAGTMIAPPAGLIERAPVAGDARFGADLDETRLPCLVFFGHRHKVAAGILDGGPSNPTEDTAFLDALDGGGRVVDAIAAARVQQAVRPPGGPRGQVALFDQHRFDAAHGQVAEHPGAR